MEADAVVDDGASQTSTTSASSTALQYSADDLQENSIALNSAAVDETVRSEGKMARLRRRLALANLQIPKLAGKHNSVVDLRTEEDKLGDISWLKKKFPLIEMDVPSTETVVTNASNAPPSLAAQRRLKQTLERKLAERRRAGQARRKELYLEDNEGILECDDGDDDDDNEEELEKDRSKKKGKLKTSSDVDSDQDYSGDDEEEQDNSDSEGSDNGKCVEEDEEKKSGAADDLPESVDLFDGASTAGSTIKDSQLLHENEPPFSEGQHENAKNDSIGEHSSHRRCSSGEVLHPVDSLNLMLIEDGDTESATGMTQPQFPNSLSQWFGEKTVSDSSDEALPSIQAPEFVNIGTFSDMDPFKDSCEDDMLMLCSGRFDDSQKLAPPPKRVDDDAESSHDDMDPEVTIVKKKRALIESDEEDEPGVDLELGEGSTNKDLLEECQVNVEGAGTEKPLTLHRTIVDSDSEDSSKSDSEGHLYDDVEEDEDDLLKEDNEEEEVKENEGEAEENGYIDDEADSDDELAVIRRLERGEFERKANREKWFDDEASLSGDDVGSDLDEDVDAVNEYEAEEGDNDDVPDSDVIRRQNHKLLLKQEKDREHLEIVKLQDRLLADGDLGGPETNRTFRLKLREEVAFPDSAADDAEVPEEELEDSVSQAHARRVEAIKWFMEHEEEQCDDKDEDDIFDVAVRSVCISAEGSISGACKAPRSLLGQPSLANAIKEVVGTSVAKQLFISNTSSKRSSSPTLQPAKRSRTSVSVLTVLEQH